MILQEKVQDNIKKYHLFKPNDKVVIGVSGGPDSLALLFILNSLKNKLRIHLHIAHLDHMLRKDSHKDLLFVKKIAKDLNLPVSTAKINVLKKSKKSSLEEAARITRYNFLFQLAKKIKAKKIAIAHTKNDQAETVLMRILRGTGLYGLRSILPKREFGALEVVRPLLNVSRPEIMQYLRQIKVKPRNDVTNKQIKFFRNRIRHKLIPILKREYNKNIQDVLCSLAEILDLDYDYLLKKSLQAKKQTVKPSSKKKVIFDLQKLLKMHPAILRMALRLAIEDLQGDTRRLNFRHWLELEDLISNRPSGSIVNLPKGIYCLKKDNRLTLSLRKA